MRDDDMSPAEMAAHCVLLDELGVGVPRAEMKRRQIERTSAGQRVRRPVHGLFCATDDDAAQCNETKSVSMPPAAWRGIDRAAFSLGVSRSALLAFAAAYFIEHEQEASALAAPL